MRVAIVCPIRMGQEYIRDYVEYHINLGFDNIILIDNNETDGPNPMDQLIGLEQYILYEDARGNHNKNRQNTLNTLMYQKYYIFPNLLESQVTNPLMTWLCLISGCQINSLPVFHLLGIAFFFALRPLALL